jgi:hypothetical protein
MMAHQKIERDPSGLMNSSSEETKKVITKDADGNVLGGGVKKTVRSH